MPKRKTREEFISEAISVHGNKYDYSLVVYKNSTTKVVIICPKHGNFSQSPGKHLIGQGCNLCSNRIKLTKENFISRATNTHKGKYDYSESIVKRTKDKTKIVCPIHGEFYQTPDNHLLGQGCPDCGQENRSLSQRRTKEEFIKKFIKTHGKKYDYSQAEFINNRIKIKIICQEHGQFKMKPNSHEQGQGCPECGRIKRNQSLVLEYEKFLKRALKIHGYKYTYDEKSYLNYTTEMRIFCSEHGWFKQIPHSHISMNAGCTRCGYIKAGQSNRKNWDLVLELFEIAHGDKYDYSKANYKKVTSKIKIICPDHGPFLQLPTLHYQGGGCQICALEFNAVKKRLNFEEFLIRAKEKHGSLYDYSDVEFVDIHTPIRIKCTKHGIFEQNPRNHFRGSGCPKCLSSRGEKTVRLILKRNGIQFKEQKRFKDLKHKNLLRCDFYLPYYNTVIEYNGIQHYEPLEIFGGIKALEDNQLRDSIKYDYLEQNSINLIIIKYDNEKIESYILKKLNLN